MKVNKFRGFTPDDNGNKKVFVNGEWIKGQWVKGSYMSIDKTTYCFKEDYDKHPDNTEHYIIFDQMTDWGLLNRHLKADVLPETVGQYIGRTDKNRREIYEGDVLKGAWKTLLIVYFDNSYLQFRVRELISGNENSIDYYDNNNGTGIEIVGNIFDNPEYGEEGSK